MSNESTLETLKSITQKNFNISPEELDVEVGLLELGLDSLMIIKLARAIETHFGLNLSARWFMTNRPSLRILAQYVDANVHKEFVDTIEKASPKDTGDLVAVPVASVGHFEGPGRLAETKDEAPAETKDEAPAEVPKRVRPTPTRGEPSSKGNGPDDLIPYQMSLFQLQMETMRDLFSAQWSNLSLTAPLAASEKSAIGPSAGASFGQDPGERPSRAKDQGQEGRPAWEDGAARGESVGEVPERLSRNFRGFVFEEEELTGSRREFVLGLIETHLARTAKSKARYLAYPELTDWKSSLHYREALSELAYPIVAESTYGGRFRDIDGNEYLDVSLGMGVNFLGHNPEYVNQALARRLSVGYGLGPQCDLAGEVAKGIAELTGHERVSFCNTGSEAVMFSMRIARAVTKRPLVAIFNGSYHGTFDGILAEDFQGRPVTYSPGTQPGMVADLLVLDYGTEEALETIAKEAHRLAAVLVEPVQSRKPSLQPQSFLKRLRILTRNKGIALIFDEMINGFRIAPGGAQEYFGIKADMCLYGKVIGGGLPLGVVAGQAKWLNAIDGGTGQEGGPSPEVIVYGGTFCRHPLSLEAAKASIAHMRERGPALQAKAKQATDDLAARLNFWFSQERVPLRMANFGAQFVIEGYGPWSAMCNPLELDLFYLLLGHKGVFVWERRTCTLATVHDQADIAFFEEAVKASVRDIRAAGFEFGPDLENGAPKIFRPMSPTMRGFYAASLKEGGQDAYHLTVGYRLLGDIDLEALETALGLLAERHEWLRTGLKHLGGDLVTETHDYVPFHLDRTSFPEGTTIADLAAHVSRPYSLDAPPLWRAGLYELDGERLFLLDASHLIMDGISLGYLIDDLNLLMNGQKLPKRKTMDQVAEAREKYLAEGRVTDGTGSAGRGTDASGTDGSGSAGRGIAERGTDDTGTAGRGTDGSGSAGRGIAERGTDDTGTAGRGTDGSGTDGRAIADLAYWTEKLKDLEPLELPLDIVAKSGSSRGFSKWREIDLGTLNALKAAAKKLGVTLNMLLNGLFAMTLNRFTGAERIIVGLAYHGRETDEAMEAIGLFISAVPQDFRVKLEDDAPAFFEGVKLATLEAIEHPNVTAAELTEALGFSPIATMLSYDQGGARIPNFPGCKAEPIEVPTIGTFYDLSFDIVEMGDGLKVNVIHSEAMTERMAEIVANYFLALVKLVTQTETFGPGVKVIDLQTKADGSWLDKLWPAMVNLNRPPDDFEIVDRLERTVKAYPDKIAVFGAGQRLTYQEFLERINLLYGALNRLNLPRDTGIASILPRIPWHVVAMFGVFKAGLCFIPFLEDTPEERLKNLFKDANVKVFIGLSRPDFLDEDILWLNPNDPCFDPKSPQSQENLIESRKEAPKVLKEQLAYVLYTSGSTGVPKGVMIHRGSLNNLIHWTVEFFGITPDDRVSCFSPFTFDISIWDIVSPLIAGAELHIISEEDRHDGAKLWDYLKTHRITYSTLIAKVAELLPGEDLPDLRVLCSCGEATNMATPRGDYKAYNTYGPTECTVTSHVFLLDGTSPPPIGRPLNQTQGIILDKQGRLCPPGRQGELVISGVLLSKGYLGQPELTAKAIEPNPYPPRDSHGQPIPGFEHIYHTGDRCTLTPNGDVSYLSRFDRQIKIRGQRIEPGEIERLLLNNGLVKQALVVKLNPEGRGDILWGYVSPADVDLDEIRRFLTLNLPAYMVPNGFTAIADLPLATTGKSDLKALPQPVFESNANEPPQTEAEVLLAKVWASVLGLSAVGRTDNFFALGGDSVKVITVTSTLQAMGYHNLNAQDFYLYQTLSELAGLLTPDGPETSPPSGPGGPGPGDPGGHGSGGPGGPTKPSPNMPPTSEPAVGEPGPSPVGAIGPNWPGSAPTGRIRDAPSQGVPCQGTQEIGAPLVQTSLDMAMGDRLQERAPFEIPKSLKTDLAEAPQKKSTATFLPLAPFQKAILSQMGLSGQGTYRERFRLTLSHLDRKAFLSRLTRLINEADVFRLTFQNAPAGGGQALGKGNGQTRPEGPWQVISESPPDLSSVLYEEDLSATPPDKLKARIMAIEASQYELIGDLGRGPLIRLALLARPNGGYELILTAHHLCLDAWSVGLVFGWLLGGLEFESKTTWSDYMAAILAQDRQKARERWADSLGRLTEATELPGYKPGPLSGIHLKHVEKLDPELTESILRTAGKLRATPAFFLEAAWALVAAKGARVGVVSYAAVHNGRSLPLAGQENVIGPCLLTVPRVIPVDPDITFSQLVARVTDEIGSSLPHSILPLGEALNAAAASKSAAMASIVGPGLLNHILNYRPFQKWPEDIGIVGIDETTQDMGFPLSVNWDREGDGGQLVLDLTYDKNSFPPAAVSSIAEAYLTVIKEALRNPETLIKDVPLCSPERAKELVQVNNAPAKDYGELSILEALAKNVGQFPERLAFTGRKASLTYRETLALTRSIGQLITERLPRSRETPRPDLLGPPVGLPVVALLFDRSIAYPVALLATMSAKAVFTPLDHQSPLDRLLYQLDETQASLLLTDSLVDPALIAEILKAKPSLAAIVLSPDMGPDLGPDLAPKVIEPHLPLGAAGNTPSGPDRPSSLDDPAYVFYTSGTTGRPKGVVISHRAIANHAFWYPVALNLNPGDISGAFAAWTFDVSLVELLCPLMVGATARVFDSEERLGVGAIYKAAKDSRLTHLWLPPQLGQIYISNYPVDNLKTLVFGGGVFPPPMELKGGDDCLLINAYGPTETTVTSCLSPPIPGLWPTDIGYPAPNCPMYVLDEALRTVPPYFPGEIAIGGVQVALGYLGQPESAAFVADPFKDLAPPEHRAERMYLTGDLAYRGSRGEFHFLGRKDRQVKLRG
ncbi:MAG: amino acid adenylation domain-containing protein, partial [Deltaproteobacteria bacterium]|nr:amino acid adenylation domain-containing protein [Deltaproteobacteria bacterium]